MPTHPPLYTLASHSPFPLLPKSKCTSVSFYRSRQAERHDFVCERGPLPGGGVHGPRAHECLP